MIKKKIIEIPNDSKICPDGSIILKELECPLANGCPAKKPLLCANNECRISCKIATCPKETPIKCLNGECVLSETNCPSSYDFHTSKECEGRNLITCANGQCARYAEECKPISVCPKDMKMCPNGTCRNLELNCPDENTCPIGLPYRCPNGKCVASNDSCLNMSGCPLGKNYKCITNGLCVSNQSDCSNYDKKFPLANGCDNDKPFKCSNGKCAADKDSCEEKLCDGDKVFCPNSGLCMSSLNECKKSKCTQIICPTNGLCVDTLEKCKTMQNCDSNTPYRCLDGQCKKFSFNFNSYSESLYCQSRVECPSYRPYLCADGSCMEKSSFCKPLVDCPEEAKIRCPDRTCVEKYEDCNKSDFQIICPPTNPILCSNNGNCVKNIFDCFEEKCPDWLPVKCISGLCVSSPRECVYKMNLISSVNDPNSNFNLTMKISCKSTDHVCYDGSCKEKPEYCPTFDGCNNINSPYKCPSGKCAKDKKSCLRDLYNNENRENELVNVTCEKGFNLCDDGICRIKCPVTNSCKNDSPYLCSNGNCVKDINECAGDSKCEIGKPFRCVDGTCQEKLSSCRKPKKLEASTDIRLFVSPGRDFKADILVDDFNDIIGSIYMPANTFTLKKTNNNETNSTQANIPSNEVISIKTIPIRTEFLYKTTKDYSEIARDIVNKLFPYGDENDTMKLEFQYAILSPVLDINFLSNKTEINQDIVLRLAYDLQSIYLDPELGQIKDKVCLAYLDRNDSGWKCVEKIITSNEPSGNFYEGKIKNSGLYSIALDINIEINSTEKPQNWIMKNFRLFVVLIGSGIFLFFVLIYIFHRIYRYRAKYIITKKKYIEMEDKEASMKEKTTHFKGQTIKDTEENMMYTDNLCKQKKNDQNNQSKNSRLEYLRSVEDSYFHKIKVFENNFDKLTKELDAAYDRYEKLKEYSNILREGRNLLSDNEKE